MNAKACQDCGKVFHDYTKWVLHHSDKMCRQKKQRLAEVQARAIVDEIAAGKRTRTGRRIRL
jgi:hypothetical protein